jgi:hypothetical protein
LVAFRDSDSVTGEDALHECPGNDEASPEANDGYWELIPLGERIR